MMFKDQKNRGADPVGGPRLPVAATLLVSIFLLGSLLLPPLARAQVARLKLQVDGVT